MATIVVEDGTGLETSNSYISAADCTTYATDRGVTLAGTVADMLIRGMDYIEQQIFKGTKATSAQALQWPRFGVYVDGYYVSETSVPQLLKDALCEIVISIDGGTDPLSSESRETKREKIGEIEVEYTAGSRNYTYIKAAEYKLRKLLRSNGQAAVNFRG